MPEVHIITDTGELVPMAPSDFENEDALQKLLADHPELIPGELVDSTSPRRWLLVTREAGIALATDEWGGNRWSLDHLMLDQDGVPTLVEVKRSRDTRSRREVVAQMLDYAANLWTWDASTVQEQLARRCQLESLDPDDEIMSLIGPDAEVQEFWLSVNANLRAGRLRLIFLADQIGPELLQIIQFLSSQFSTADVLAVEVRQREGGGLKVVTSSVLGRTLTARSKQGSGSRERLTAEAFEEFLQSNCDAALVQAMHDLMNWVIDHGGRITYGTGRKQPSCFFNWDGPTGDPIWALAVELPRSVVVPFEALATRPPFDSPDLREEYRRRLTAISSVIISPQALQRRPSFSLDVLVGPVERQKLFDVLTWFTNQLALPS